MFLKGIELFGFKSFADRSKIEFEDGIAALLGPNGCGKSNVVDAVKWVLGEQSTKSLRAEKMEDVIFNGTEARKALNIAEVTLILSNEESILPIDTAEIAIKRRLYRSGESQYFVNNAPVKLKDIRELFFDTGIGKSAYSVMEQGKIDQVLSNKPEERRMIFEEASGITKYRIKGAEAERKLANTEENMHQVENILREVKRSYDSLKVQAEKTEEFRRLQDEIFNLELDVNLLRMKEFLEERNKKEELLKSRTQKRDEIRENIDTINESLEENLDIVNSMESRLIESQKKIYGVDLEKNNKASQLILLDERKNEVHRRIQADTDREKAIQDRIEGIEEQIRDKGETISRFGERLVEIDKNIGEFKTSIGSAESRIEHNEAAVERSNTEIGRAEERRDTLQLELRGITEDIVTQLDARLKETGYSMGKRRDLEERISSLLETIRINLAGKKNLFEDSRDLKGVGAGRIAELLDEVIGALGASGEKIAEIEETFEEYAGIVPTFLEEFLSPEGIITKKRAIDSQLEELRKQVAENRGIIEKRTEENRGLSRKITEYRKTLEELRMNQVQLKTQKSNAEEAVAGLRGNREEQIKQLAKTQEDIESAKTRISSIAEQEETVRKEKAELEETEKQLRRDLTSLEENISVKNKDLMEKEKKLKGHIRESDDIQSKIEKIQMDLATIQTEIRNLYENFRDRHSRDLSEYEERIYEIKIPITELRKGLGETREKQKNLGQVNLMAPEEFAEVEERYNFLTGQLEDLEKARNDLKQITRQIKTESEELFLETYDKIKRNFHSMFRRLFGGGRGELTLSDPDDVLVSGIEIYAQPPGKKLKNIALLSGGERSLTAVALLFATYMVKPSPFCILDEIDAALDENNVGTFVNLMTEFGRNSQFIIITHNKKTVTGAGTLLGVTMSEPGVSRIVSIRLGQTAKEAVTQ